MDFDLELVERCRQEHKNFLRFYRWKPYAISIGYHQKRANFDRLIDTKKCESDGIDIVVRPTGGRAVLHSEELTYSVVMKSQDSSMRMFREISEILNEGISKIETGSERLQMLSLTNAGPASGLKNNHVCFTTAVKNEINYLGRKLVGSAQRDFGGIVLQHGSVLIGEGHKNIVNYLVLNGEQEHIKRELEEKTICLNEILGREVSYEEVRDGLLAAFEENFGNFTNRNHDFPSSAAANGSQAGLEMRIET